MIGRPRLPYGYKYGGGRAVDGDLVGDFDWEGVRD